MSGADCLPGAAAISFRQPAFARIRPIAAAPDAADFAHAARIDDSESGMEDRPSQYRYHHVYGGCSAPDSIMEAAAWRFDAQVAIRMYDKAGISCAA